MKPRSAKGNPAAFLAYDDQAEADRLGFTAPFWKLNWDFAIAKVR
jgi:hypothetical protein